MKGTIMTYPHASREPALSALNGIRRVGAALRTYAARIPTSCGLCQGRSQGGRLCLYCHDAAVRSMAGSRSEEHTSELQSLMRTSSAVFCLKKKNTLT